MLLNLTPVFQNSKFPPYDLIIDLILCFSHREYASTITKNFTARYDPYTESIEILDTKREILKNLRGVSREIRTLSDALDRL